MLYIIYWKVLSVECTEIHHTGFEPLINKMSVINRGIENELVEKNTLRIIFRNSKLNLWSSSSLIKTFFSIVQRAGVSYFLKLCSATLYSSCQDLNGHSGLDEMPSSPWLDRGAQVLIHTPSVGGLQVSNEFTSRIILWTYSCLFPNLDCAISLFRAVCLW